MAIFINQRNVFNSKLVVLCQGVSGLVTTFIEKGKHLENESWVTVVAIIMSTNKSKQLWKLVKLVELLIISKGELNFLPFITYL